MIQRIQTVFLAVAALLGIAVFLFPLASFSVKGFTFDLFVTGYKNLSPDCPFVFKINTIFHLIFLVVLILLSVSIIFLYKRRDLQMRLCRFGMMASMVFVFLIFMFADTIKNRFVKDFGVVENDILVKFGIGSILPLVMIVMFFLANRFIKKDDNLVKSADRLR